MDGTSDDPFEILGVEPSASDKELRRAYLRQVKEHPPERDPEGFRRIREARC
jgi:curved DNA-binding protein CbpA